ncbi:MAG: tetratricopeptide repeat protein [Trichocoleus desertorum ATA4-8-CV12]|jgi:tetratricopeptide (TPR) repeat protein|nr:tetratricopeptide repeat protein [Trichocoleus desertorum ATA4-8-CV12]
MKSDTTLRMRRIVSDTQLEKNRLTGLVNGTICSLLLSSNQSSSEEPQKIQDLARKVEFLQKSLQKASPELFFTATDHLKQGHAFLSESRFLESIASLNKAIELEPNSLAAWNLLATAQNASGSYKEAIESLDRAIHLQHNNAQAWFVRGIVFSNLAQYQKAIKSLDQALQTEYEDAYIWYAKARCYALQGNAALTVRCLRWAINFNPSCRAMVASDPTFSQIREDEEFINLTTYK